MESKIKENVLVLLRDVTLNKKEISPLEQDRTTLSDLSQNHVLMFGIYGVLRDICPQTEERL
jgi:hypothetical protein